MDQDNQSSILSRQQVDKFVAGKIRERRMALGFTQQMLANRINVTYQQAQKYERGLNRVSAGRMFQIARVLGVHVSYFYEGVEEGDTQTQQTAPVRPQMDLVRNFSRIQSSKQQDAFRQLCRSMAEG